MKKTLAWLRFLAALGAVAGTAACSHDIQSPIPKADGPGAEPDLVCNAKPVSQSFSTVVLHGEAFTPMPSKTLEDKPELILPKIELLQTQALDGAMVQSAPEVIQDDPAHPDQSRVHWASEQLMSFDVKPEDMLLTGVFSVRITNPDGKSTTTIDKGLAVLPPPVISDVMPPAICDDQADQTITVTGKNFLFYDGKTPTVTVGAPPDQKTYGATADPKSCTALQGNFTEMNVQLCTSMTFTIPKGDFQVTEATKVAVVVTNPEPADCASSDAITITIEPPPEVDAVVPATVCQGGSQLTITGKNFAMGATVAIDCGGTPVNASGSTVTSDGTQIGATFGAGATPGDTCDVVVKNPDGCEDRPLPHKTVSVVTGPIVFYADPPVVYNGINTRITIFATSIKPPLPADAVTIVPTGTTMPVTQLTFNTVPNHPNRLQAVVPASQAPGAYDLTLKDSSGCFATLPKAITVTSDLTVTVKGVKPPFGYSGDDTAITIFRDAAAASPMDKPFVETPRVFLNPTNPAPTDIAVEVESVAFVDKDTATGVVPAGTPVHGYDLVLVNPDGSVGLLANAFQEVMSAPPGIATATPSSIVNAANQQIVLAGTDFGAGDMVSLQCVDAMGNPVAAPMVAPGTPSCTGSSCTQTITVNGSTLAPGDVCVVRITNMDGSYGEYSAVGVTGSSLNISAPSLGTTMNVGRRALSAASGDATTAARFVYALGGDNGTAAGAMDSVEFAPVDIFGKLGAWTVQPTTLKSKRTLAGSATIGRYIYLVGGDDGTGPVATAERALILSPRETPVIADVDLGLAMAGLDEGEYHYRVSAIFDPKDTDNPGGESLASDPFSIKLPAFPNKKITVTLVWKAPVDALKQPLPGVVGYRIYRTAKPNDPPGTEVLLATVNDPMQITFVDDGTMTPGTEKPLPLGATGQWLPLPNLATARSGLGVAAALDPAAPDTYYVYALLGKTGATTGTPSYEVLTVTVAPNGRQTVSAAWAGQTTTFLPRWQIGAFVADQTVQSNYAGQRWIFFGAGKDPATNAAVGNVDAARVQAGGALGSLSIDPPTDMSPASAGYGVCAANQQLFVFGGQGGSPSASIKSTQLFSQNKPANVLPPPQNGNWNNEGVSLVEARYLLGSTVQSSFIFLLGGQTGTSMASNTTELVVW